MNRGGEKIWMPYLLKDKMFSTLRKYSKPKCNVTLYDFRYKKVYKQIT